MMRDKVGTARSIQRGNIDEDIDPKRAYFYRVRRGISKPHSRPRSEKINLLPLLPQQIKIKTPHLLHHISKRQKRAEL